MIVCVCHRVADRDIVRAVDAGALSFEALQAQTQLGTRCGSCNDCAREIFDAACTRARAVGAVGTFAIQGVSLV